MILTQPMTYNNVIAFKNVVWLNEMKYVVSAAPTKEFSKMKVIVRR